MTGRGMHWVLATDTMTGKKIPVNLAAMCGMLRVKQPDPKPGALVGKLIDVTMLFMGGMAVTWVNGQKVIDYANLSVLESPKELLALTRIDVPMIDTPDGPRPMKVEPDWNGRAAAGTDGTL